MDAYVSDVLTLEIVSAHTRVNRRCVIFYTGGNHSRLRRRLTTLFHHRAILSVSSLVMTHSALVHRRADCEKSQYNANRRTIHTRSPAWGSLALQDSRTVSHCVSLISLWSSYIRARSSPKRMATRNGVQRSSYLSWS